MTWKEIRSITFLLSILGILFAVLLVVLGIRYRENRPAPNAGTDDASALSPRLKSRNRDIISIGRGFVNFLGDRKKVQKIFIKYSKRFIIRFFDGRDICIILIAIKQG